ncbi:MAG: alpha/beta hydrolase [Rikenellaceae bacterium]
MKHLLLLLALIIGATAQGQYVPDILGEGFEQLTIDQGEAYDGAAVATLVRHTPLEDVSRAALYIHGYNDYFFQREMAEQFIDHAWQFYALDLRRYGRSLREWQRPSDLRQVDEYFADIDAAVAQMHSEGIDEIILVAHSTGGLTTSLYCDQYADNMPFSALILNSPFFDMNLGGGLYEGVGVPIVSGFGAIFRNCKVQGASDEVGGYARSLSSQYDGEWEFDPALKTLTSLPITAGWIRAIHKGHKRLQRGLQIPCPVLVMYSDNSVWGNYSADYMRGDSVLDVADIDKYADNIGQNVTEVVVEGGMHDLVLSSPEVRYALYDLIFEWLEDL